MTRVNSPTRYIFKGFINQAKLHPCVLLSYLLWTAQFWSLCGLLNIWIPADAWYKIKSKPHSWLVAMVTGCSHPGRGVPEAEGTVRQTWPRLSLLWRLPRQHWTRSTRYSDSRCPRRCHCHARSPHIGYSSLPASDWSLCVHSAEHSVFCHRDAFFVFIQAQHAIYCSKSCTAAFSSLQRLRILLTDQLYCYSMYENKCIL